MPSPLSLTELFRARANHTKTLAEMNAHARVMGARILLHNACLTLASAKNLVDSATAELKAAEAEELEAAVQVVEEMARAGGTKFGRAK